MSQNNILDKNSQTIISSNNNQNKSENLDNKEEKSDDNLTNSNDSFKPETKEMTTDWKEPEIIKSIDGQNQQRFSFKEFFKFERGKPKQLKGLLIVAFFVAILSVGGVIASKRYLGYSPPEKDQSTLKSNKSQDENKTEQSSLDGTQVDPALAKRNPLAIVIENHPDARPQAGLSKASIVYEVITEGGITRFLAIFAASDSERVGPVRSARTFFVSWAEELGAYFVHAGGSANGLEQIRRDNVLDLPHDSKNFWRERRPGIASEHTLYTSTIKLREQTIINKWTQEANFTSWQFKTDLEKAKRLSGGKITLNFSSPSYKVVYDYDSDSNSYRRTLAGLPHKDDNTGSQLSPKNIVIQKVSRREVQSAGKAVGEIADISSGEAVIFQDGLKIDGRWEKTAAKRRTIFYDSTGAEIKFNPGQTFIEIFDPSSSFSFESGTIITPDKKS